MSLSPIPQSAEPHVRPAGVAVMRQRWAQLLFLHWQVSPDAVRRTLPAGLTVDVFGGGAWIGVVPFFMEGVRPRGCPAVPGLSDFLELNVRTYVRDAAGRPGVWFYSLDCNQGLAVRIARAFFHLPYEHATMRATVDAAGLVDYFAQRRGAEAESRFLYRLSGATALAAPGSLEYFLVERYALLVHAPRSGRVWRGRVWHEPYRIGRAEVPVWSDVALRQAGFDVGGRAPDHACAARPVDVEIFGLEAVG